MGAPETKEVKHFYASSAAAETAAGEHDAHSPEVVSKERMLALLSVVLAGIGIAIGWFAFIERSAAKDAEDTRTKMAAG